MKYYSQTDVGLVRKANQDSVVVVKNKESNILAAVCDGIGGSKAGDVASKFVCDRLEEYFADAPSFNNLQAIKLWLVTTLTEINNQLYQKSLSNRKYQGMGTTLVCALVSGDYTVIANAGDSRCYKAVDNQLELITKDHTMINDMVLNGEITQQQAKVHPKRNIITNALGVINRVNFDVFEVDMGYQYLLLCSDGLHGLVEEVQLLKILNEKLTLEKKVYKMIDCANQNGGYDNISVVILKR